MNNKQAHIRGVYDKRFIRTLKKIYEYKVFEHQNYYLDESNDVSTYRLPKSLTKDERDMFESSGYLLNDIRHYKHDDFINDIKMITESEEIKMLVTQMFFKAVGEGYHRGIQPIISYYFGINVPRHQYEVYHYNPQKYQYSNNKIPCRVCGLIKDYYDNISKTIYQLNIGYCRLDYSFDYLSDIQDIIKRKGILEIDEKWIIVLSTLLKAIEGAPRKETFSELEKRISKLKLLPNSTHCSRTWLLRSLSVLGIIPNYIKPGYSLSKDFITFEEKMEYEEIVQKEAVNHRSEVSWPYSAWRGEMGINKDLAYELFPQLKSIKLGDAIRGVF